MARPASSNPKRRAGARGNAGRLRRARFFVGLQAHWAGASARCGQRQNATARISRKIPGEWRSRLLVSAPEFRSRREGTGPRAWRSIRRENRRGREYTGRMAAGIRRALRRGLPVAARGIEQPGAFLAGHCRPARRPTRSWLFPDRFRLRIVWARYAAVKRLVEATLFLSPRDTHVSTRGCRASGAGG